MDREGHEDTKFFIGTEVEHTPAYGMYTLFVTGVQPVKDIEEQLLAYNQVEHIFFGANHSVQANKVGPEFRNMLLDMIEQSKGGSTELEDIF